MLHSIHYCFVASETSMKFFSGTMVVDSMMLQSVSSFSNQKFRPATVMLVTPLCDISDVGDFMIGADLRCC